MILELDRQEVLQERREQTQTAFQNLLANKKATAAPEKKEQFIPHPNHLLLVEPRSPENGYIYYGEYSRIYYSVKPHAENEPITLTEQDTLHTYLSGDTADSILIRRNGSKVREYRRYETNASFSAEIYKNGKVELKHVLQGRELQVDYNEEGMLVQFGFFPSDGDKNSLVVYDNVHWIDIEEEIKESHYVKDEDIPVFLNGEGKYAIVPLVKRSNIVVAQQESHIISYHSMQYTDFKQVGNNLIVTRRKIWKNWRDAEFPAFSELDLDDEKLIYDQLVIPFSIPKGELFMDLTDGLTSPDEIAQADPVFDYPWRFADIAKMLGITWKRQQFDEKYAALPKIPTHSIFEEK